MSDLSSLLEQLLPKKTKASDSNEPSSGGVMQSFSFSPASIVNFSPPKSSAVPKPSDPPDEIDDILNSLKHPHKPLHPAQSAPAFVPLSSPTHSTSVSSSPSKGFSPFVSQSPESNAISDILKSLQSKDSKTPIPITSSDHDLNLSSQTKTFHSSPSTIKNFSSTSDIPSGIVVADSILGAAKPPEIKIEGYSSRFVALEVPKLKPPTVDFSFTVRPPPKWENSIRYDISKATIQVVLDSIAPYTELILPEGQYVEEIRISKPIALKADGKVELIGKGLGNVVECSAEFILIEGLDIKQTISHSGGGILVKTGYLFLNKVKIESELTNSLYVYGTASIQCEQATFLKSEHVTVVLSNNSKGMFSRCLFSNSGGYGASCNDNSHVVFENCIFKENKSCGLSSIGFSSVIVSGCIFDSNTYSGYELCSKGQHMVQKCTFQNHKQTGITLQGEIMAIIKDSKFIKNQLACLKAYMSATGFCFHNTFEDSVSNMMVLAHENSLIQLEGDEFTGNCNGAIASFDQGQIIANMIKLRNVNGSGIICYNNGKCHLSNSELKDISKGGIQARSNSEINIKNCKLVNIGDSAFSIQSGVQGSIKSTTIQNAGHGSSPSQGGISISDNQTPIDITDVEILDCNNYGIQCDRSILDISGMKLHKNGVCNLAFNGESTKVTIRNLVSTGATETSIQVHSQADVEIYDSELKENNKFGIVARDSNVLISDTKIVSNNECGLNLFGGSNVTLQNCLIAENGRCGFQIHQAKTKVYVIDCKINTHLKGASFLVVDNASLTCTGCTLFNSCQNHIQANQNAQIVLDGCDISKTTCGNSIQLQNCHMLIANGTVIHDDGKTGILVANDGVLELKGSTIRNCGICGINVMGGGSIDVSESIIEKNGKIGIQVLQGGKAEIKDSTIRDHLQVGILMGSGADVNELNNTFERNLQGNIYSESNK